MCVVNEQVVLEVVIDIGHTYLIGSSVANTLCCME